MQVWQSRYMGANVAFHMSTSLTNNCRTPAVRAPVVEPDPVLNVLACATCQRPDSAAQPLKACRRCRLHLYCDRNCQVKHWRAEHKTRCYAFTNPTIKARAFLHEAVIDMLKLDPICADLPLEGPVPVAQAVWEKASAKFKYAGRLLAMKGDVDYMRDEVMCWMPRRYLRDIDLPLWNGINGWRG
eukprot:g4764.t1